LTKATAQSDGAGAAATEAELLKDSEHDFAEGLNARERAAVAMEGGRAAAAGGVGGGARAAGGAGATAAAGGEALVGDRLAAALETAARDFWLEVRRVSWPEARLLLLPHSAAAPAAAPAAATGMAAQ
jgi:hypothetical protein